MVRKLLWAVGIVGALLIVAPFAIGLPDRAAGGEKMMVAFEPIMEKDNVEKTATYYYDVFVPLGEVVPAMSQENIDTFKGYVAGFTALGVDAENMVPALAAAMGMTEEQVQGFLDQEFPAMSQTLQALPQMETDFSNLVGLMDSNVAVFEQVPAGLTHYEPLVTTMTSQRTNYDKVAGLPDFRLFTWFFVVPGTLLVLLSAAGLIAVKRDRSSVIPTSSSEP
jgi:hypothetical protein